MTLSSTGGEVLRTFQDIDVKLVGHISNPYEVAVASARTCYSGRGVIYPEDVSKDEKAVVLRDRIASSTLDAGHLTTRQHAHFVFAISGVSRQFIWSFLHSHPYYNSEQVSQRYVRVKKGSFVAPPLEGRALEIYTETLEAQMGDYERLIQILKTPLSGDYYERFPSRKKYHEKWDSAVDKRCFEVARYVLGLGTTAYMYHTVSALTLLRYHKLVQIFETPTEQRAVVEKMISSVRAVDPLFEKELSDPMPLEKTLEYRLLRESVERTRTSKDFIREFDTGLHGKTSALTSYTANPEKTLADGIRVALGRTIDELSEEEALDLLLDPKNNPVLSDTLGVGTLDRLSQCLHHISFTFHKKISHAADSQDQRHRTVLASRPLLKTHFSETPDFITPFGVTQTQEALDVYTASMGRSWSAVSKLRNLGVSEEFAFYLLPNALSIRMVSTGDLLSYHHKWKMRSCYNAQEEIFRATIDEITQVNEKFPLIGRHIKAPCYLRMRSGTTPYCPEGDKFCGLPVWKYEIGQYTRKSL